MLAMELPQFEATWWPLMMEPIPGGGESLTVAVVVRAASGQSQVRQSILPPVLSSIFSASGKGVQTLVGETVIDVQNQLDEGRPVEALELPFGGFRLGSPREGVARDLSEVFEAAIRLSAAFGHSSFGQRAEVSDSSREAFNDWAERVRMELLAHAQRITLEGEHFNVRVQLATKQVRFGLLRGGYAANFGVLRPGHTSGDMRSLKVKLFDLEALRRDTLVPVTRSDVVVGCPPHQLLTVYSRKEVDTFFSSLEFIAAEAKARDIELVRCGTQEQAAAHIRSRLMAA
jgi:hypothetical protein